MNLEYPYWYFQSAIPPRICDDIIKYGLAQKEQIGITGEVEDGNGRTGLGCRYQTYSQD